MILEKIGQFFFQKVNPFFFYLLLILPILIGSSYLWTQSSKTKDLEERFYASCKKGNMALAKKKKKEQFLARHSHAKPYFLEEKIESLSLLDQERNQLENLLKHPALIDKKRIESRLSFLLSGQNHFLFTQEAIRTSTSIKETEEKQRYPVQMSGEDLKKTLSLLEDIPIDSYLRGDEPSPQIMITDFRLGTKETELKTQAFEVEIQFIKREFNL